MKALYCAIAASLTLAALPTFQASARSVEPDYPCYMRTSAGKVLDLTAAMCGIEPFRTAAANSSQPTDSAVSSAAAGSSYDPRYRSVRTEVRGGVTRTISGGAGDDLSDERDRTTVISPGIDSYGSTYRGKCVYASDLASDGSLCGERASTERAGGQ